MDQFIEFFESIWQFGNDTLGPEWHSSAHTKGFFGSCSPMHHGARPRGLALGLIEQLICSGKITKVSVVLCKI